MNKKLLEKTISVLKILLNTKNPEIIKCVVEALIEDLEDFYNKKYKI